MNPELKRTNVVCDPRFDQPSCITNALGNTACYAYDLRGRKTAKYGTAIQPVWLAMFSAS